MRTNLLLLILVIFFISCNDKLINSKHESVTVNKKEFGNNIEWPVFESENKKLESLLNDSLSMEAVLGQSYEEIVEELKTSEEEFGMKQGTESTSYQVNMNDGFMLDIDIYQVIIAARPEYYDYKCRINLQTGEKLKLEDLVSEEQLSEIIEICNREVQKQADKVIAKVKAEDGEDLEEYYGDVSFTDYHMNNFTLGPDHISFEYDVALPSYMRYYDYGLIHRFNYLDFEKYTKEGSLLKDYINKNRDRIKENIEKDDTKEEESESYKTVSSLQELKTAINGAEDKTIILLENDITIDETLIISKSNITLTGNASYPPVISTPRTDIDVLFLKNCENVTIENLKMLHAPEEGYCDAGVVYLNNCKNITIQNCDISGSGVTGISVADNCFNINILKNKIYDCSYVGIEMFSGNSEIKQNLFIRNGSENDDISITPEVKKTVILKDNKYLGVKNFELTEYIESYKYESDSVKKEFSNQYGSGSIIEYVINKDLKLIELEWYEIDDFNMSVYYKDNKPGFVHWSYQYGDPDAPEDYGYDPDKKEYFATYSAYNIVDILRKYNNEEEVISDVNKLDSIRSELQEFLIKWDKILNKGMKPENLFEGYPVLE